MTPDARDERADTQPAGRSTVAERLSRWPFFRELAPDTFRALTPLLRMEGHPAGEILLLDGQHYRSLYLVARGVTSHSQISAEGREHVLSYPGPGRFLNLLQTIDGGPQPGSILSVTDVDLYSLPEAAFCDLLAHRPDLGLAVALVLASENRRLSETARGLALDPVRKRLAAFLLESAESTPPQQRWTQDMIAAHIGTVRDVVGRILRDLIRDGLINKDHGQLVIIDREALMQEAGFDEP